MSRLIRLPTALTPFLGRSTELRAIRALLNEASCRLITLVGPGGIGKTRLVLEATAAMAASVAAETDGADAEAMTNDYPHGVFFVDLQTVASADLLPVTIINALGITPGSLADPLDQLIRYLSERKVLLVFDNFEHLLNGAAYLTPLLVAAPGLKMIVTSREALNLQEEWLFPVGGLDLPGEKVDRPNWREEAQSTSSVQLFAACARRARPDFSLENEIESVVEICHLVEGMPLAIELAAAWTRMLRCEIIAREIKGNIHFLASNLRNIPERHRSIQVIFEQTWRMLSPEEQQIFQRLSVFRGGFDQTAARQILQASLAGLLKLADKSLLRLEPSTAVDGSRERFGLHELLRHFAREHLSQNTAEDFQTHERHCAYYLDFLRQRSEDVLGGRQQAAVQEIHAELENIRAAWVWATQNNHCKLLGQAVQALDTFFQFRSRFTEGASLFEQTLKDLENIPAREDRLYTQAQLHVCMGWYNIRLGKFDLANTAFNMARQQYQKLPCNPPPQMGSDPLAGLSILAVLRGEYAEAVTLGEQVRQNGQERADPHNLMLAHYLLAGAWLAQGDYELARQHAQETCSRATDTQNAWLLAYGLIAWGNALCALQDTRQARRLYEESYRIRKTFNDPEGMALALNHLGNVALLEADFPEALRLYQEGYQIYATIFDRGGISTALNGLGNSALGMGRLAEARDYLTNALRVAFEIHYIPLAISILLSIAELFVKAGLRERGMELLNFARTSPSSDQLTRRLAAEKLVQYHSQRETDNETQPSSSQENLDAVINTLLLEAEGLAIDTQSSPPAQVPPQTRQQEKPVYELERKNLGLLTEREIQILRFMNEGLSNQSIAEQLILSLGTVKWYTSQIYGKLQITSRTQAIARARELGIL